MPRTSPRRRTGAAPAASQGSGDRLDTYREMRDFSRTREPAGAVVPVEALPVGSRFVVQRHRARRLHYDLRFEMAGVLASWAVPRGPTLDPKARRNAIHVEDHPIEYLDFEGVIPSGEYGGGDVIVWDIGTWEPVKTDDPRAAVEAAEVAARGAGGERRGRVGVGGRGGGGGGGGPLVVVHQRGSPPLGGGEAGGEPRSG